MTWKVGLAAAAAFAGGALAASTAAADENLLGYSYGSETLPQGKTEAYVWITHRAGKDEGTYRATDYKFELERGLTDRLQVSGYLNFASHKVEGLEPEFEDRDRDFGLQGTQVSFKYAILSPYKDPIGLAVYIEPGYSRIDKVSGERNREWELEAKLIAQKNFLNDQLIWIGNLTYEQEWEKEKEDGVWADGWEREAALEVTTGLSYRFAPNWYAGLEARYHSEYPNFPADVHREHYAIFAGPTIHWGGERMWVTATWLPQLVGSPSPEGNRHFEEHEKNEFRLKAGYNF
jgi:uncharacterized protein DUF6662